MKKITFMKCFLPGDYGATFFEDIFATLPLLPLLQTFFEPFVGKSGKTGCHSRQTIFFFEKSGKIVRNIFQRNPKSEFMRHYCLLENTYGYSQVSKKNESGSIIINDCQLLSIVCYATL